MINRATIVPAEIGIPQRDIKVVDITASKNPEDRKLPLKKNKKAAVVTAKLE